MDSISNETALDQHGISTLHQTMDNGELRFRLKKSDGTAYIRTEAGDIGAWQNSHFHKSVRETYIIQSGWIAYAEERAGQPVLKVYTEGEIFTTRPSVVHNVYMAANAVVHTVKHGTGTGDDRDTEHTRIFDQACKALQSEEDIRAYAAQYPLSGDSEETYSSEYRHFDNLIWQVPAWITAIFALSTNVLGSDKLKLVSDMSGVGTSGLTVVFLLIVAGTILCFSHVKYRFRVHQKNMKRYSRTPIWKSASTWTQAVINIQAFALLMLALLILDIGLPWAFLISLLLFGALTANLERALRKA